MKYQIVFKPRALKDCKNIEKKVLTTIFSKIKILSDDLKGDVKKLTNFTPEYRLKVGDYRILFETEKDRIIIYRVRHRKNVYGQEVCMITLHPKILEKDGEKEFAIIPYDEFLKIQEELEDYESLKALREAKMKEGNAETVSFENAKRILSIE